MTFIGIGPHLAKGPFLKNITPDINRERHWIIYYHLMINLT